MSSSAPKSAAQSVRVAGDIGGTFTDIVLMAADGALHESKIATTPADPSITVIDVVHEEVAEGKITAAYAQEHYGIDVPEPSS